MATTTPPPSADIPSHPTQLCDRPGCNKIFTDFSLLRSHRASCFSRAGDCCANASLIKNEAGERDNTDIDQEDGGEDTDGHFKCTIGRCEWVYLTKELLDKHVQEQEHGEEGDNMSEESSEEGMETGPYRCSYEGCGKEYTFKSGLYRHVNSKHKKGQDAKERKKATPKTPTESAYSSPSSEEGEEDRRLRPFPCPEKGCGVRLTDAFAQKKHIRFHTGDKTYTCNINGCNFSHDRRGVITVHHGHHGFRYFCDESLESCNFACNRKGELAAHRREMHGMN